MPVYKMDKLPPDHSFAGTRIVFVDALVKRAVARQRARDPDPTLGAERDTEQFLLEKFGDRYMSPSANDVEGDSDVE